MRWLISLLPRTTNYFLNDGVPFYYKLLLLIPVFWLFTPVARIANIIPVVGLLDEFTVILLTMALFTHLVGGYLRRKDANNGKKEKPSEIIEGEYYVVESPTRQTKVK